MYCTHCGAQLEDNIQFCARCGKPVAGAASPSPGSAPELALVPATPPAKKTQSRFFLWELVGAGLLALTQLLLCVGNYYVELDLFGSRAQGDSISIFQAIDRGSSGGTFWFVLAFFLLAVGIVQLLLQALRNRPLGKSVLFRYYCIPFAAALSSIITVVSVKSHFSEGLAGKDPFGLASALFEPEIKAGTELEMVIVFSIAAMVIFGVMAYCNWIEDKKSAVSPRQ